MKCFHPRDVRNPATGHYIQVPCRHCPACFHNQQKESGIKFILESKYAKGFSYFITLTFDDEVLAKMKLLNLSSELSKPFATSFIKLVRRRFEYHGLGQLRFALVGEYGDDYGRAHYHLSLFGVPFGWKDMYRFIQDCWKYGFVQVSSFTDGRAMYVGKYSVKALFKDCPHEQKPFLFQSNCLGRGLLDDSKAVSLLKKQQRFYLTSSNGSVFNLPRYFRDRIFDAYDIYLRNEFNFWHAEDIYKLHNWRELLTQKRVLQDESERLFFKRLRESRKI